jgi:uncharacterized protein YkwD
MPPVVVPPDTAFNLVAEAEMLTLINAERTTEKLRTLPVDATLAEIARWRSWDMIERNYFSHVIPPSGSSFIDVLRREGYCYSLAAEAIGWNTYPDDVASQVAFDGFMKSSSHRELILGPGWSHIGVGAWKGSDGKKIWTLLFAVRC